MKEQQFIEQYQQNWRQIELFLFDPRSHYLEDFPKHYRKLCQQLTLARSRGFSSTTVTALENLVYEAYQKLYEITPRQPLKTRLYKTLVSFPQAFRREWRFMLASALLFFLPSLLAYMWLQTFPDDVYYLMPIGSIQEIESMYEPINNQSFSEERTGKDDVMMFGFYIYNNISLALQTFGYGFLGAIGSLFVIIYNGIILGAVSGHLMNKGYALQTLFPFVIGHGSFELIAIVISGGAGLKIGYAVIAPKRYTRSEAIKQAGLSLVPIIYGFVLMLLVAAGIEAFWSPRDFIPNEVKYVVGALLWLLVLGYLFFAGRKS